MLQKRRLTVHPVDRARFCGYNNGTIVSVLNGADHLVLDPAATDQDEAQPLPSRVLAHAYAGAQLASINVDPLRERIAEAAVNAGNVVACRVTALSNSVGHAGPSGLVFFSGCQRLAEVQLNDEAGAVGEPVADDDVCPMQCFHVKSDGTPGAMSLDIAVFMADTQQLCTCTPQLGKVQTLRFNDRHVCCMGPGRAGRAEVTVVLTDNVAVLCGLSGDSAADEDEELWGDTTSASGDSALTDAARRMFAEANARSKLRVLHLVQLPSPPVDSAHTAAPRRVEWSGDSTLWVVYADGAVVAVHCAEAARNSAAGEDEQSDHQSVLDGVPADQPVLVTREVVQTQLVDAAGQAVAVHQVRAHADPLAPVLHVAFTAASASGSATVPQLYYGSARLTHDSAGSDGASLSVQWRLQSISYDEQLYGVRFERGQHHIITQGARGRGPLYVATLPRSAPVHTSAAAQNGAQQQCLASTIMSCPESDLGGYCKTCENLLRELHVSAQRLSSADDAEAAFHRLTQAQHALYALLRRQQEFADVTDLDPSESQPHRLLQRAARLHRQLSAYVLFLRLGLMGAVSQPLKEVLRLDSAAEINKAANQQWTSLMRDTFRGSSVYESAVSTLAIWQAPLSLCVESLLSQLSLSLADPACTMTAVLSRMDALTTEYALVILYFSYLGMGCAGDAGVAVPPLAVQQQQCQWRESFLVLFGQPVELNVWAFTCYAVDHGMNPAEELDDTTGAYVYLLGSAVHHLGVAPYAALLSPVLSGLANVAALDVLLHLIPSCLTTYAAASEGLPLAVSMRLLCVALRAGSHAMIEALYDAMRSSSPLLQDLAAQPLAFSALAKGDVSGMRGWVEVGSPVAATIERTLLAADSAPQRDVVLISFYALLQRYEDALRVCSTAAAADPTQAQRLHVVAAYLRSLLSASSAAWGEASAATPAASSASHVEDALLLPVDARVRRLWRGTTLAAPLLETSPATLSENAKQATAAARAGGSARGPAATGEAPPPPPPQPRQQQLNNGAGYGGAPPAPRAAPVFRPSTLLMSVDRGTGSRDVSSPPPSSAAFRG